MASETEHLTSASPSAQKKGEGTFSSEQMLDASAEECKSLKGTTCNTSQEGLEKLKQCSNESRPGICVGEAAIGPEDVAPVKS